MSGEWKLTEEQHRAKIIELLDGMNDTRMNLWIYTGTTALVLDADVIERVLREELTGRSHEVRMYWTGTCNCGIRL